MKPVISKRAVSIISSLSWFAALILVIAIIITNFTCLRVPSSSMEPTINKGEMAIAKFASFDDIDYDDIIVFYAEPISANRKNSLSVWYNENILGHTILLKRVIGLPGDTIEVKDGFVWRNGEKLDPNYLVTNTGGEYKANVVPDNAVFCMGDNRNFSVDSRVYGAFSADGIIGKVVWH